MNVSLASGLRWKYQWSAASISSHARGCTRSDLLAAMEQPLAKTAANFFTGDHFDFAGANVVDAFFDFFGPALFYVRVRRCLVEAFNQTINQQATFLAGKSQCFLQQFGSLRR